MHRQARRLPTAPALLLTLLFASAPGGAAELDLSTGASVEFSDNIRRAPEDTRSEAVGVLWGGMWLRHDTQALQLGVSSTVELRDHERDIFQDRTLVDLSASANARLIPRRLHWALEDYFRQIRIDTEEPLTPGNRQDSNVFWTGPDLYFQFGAPTSLDLGARYGYYYYEVSAADNERNAAFARLTRRVWPRLTASLHAEALQVRYRRSESFTDFDREDGFLGLDIQLRHSELELEAGRTRIERDDALAPLEGALLGMAWRRPMAGDGLLRLGLRRHYTEGGATLLAAGGDPMLVDLAAASEPGEIAYLTRAEASYTRLLGGVDTELALFASDEDFVGTEPDRRDAGLRLDLGFSHSADWSTTLYGGHRRIDYYRDGGRIDNDSLIGARIEHRLGRRTVAGLEVNHNRRMSNLVGEDYQENVVLLSVRHGERPPEIPR